MHTQEQRCLESTSDSTNKHFPQRPLKTRESYLGKLLANLSGYKCTHKNKPACWTTNLAKSWLRSSSQLRCRNRKQRLVSKATKKQTPIGNGKTPKVKLLSSNSTKIGPENVYPGCKQRLDVRIRRRDSPYPQAKRRRTPPGPENVNIGNQKRTKQE